MADGNRYVLGQGKVFLDEIDLATGLPKDKARFVGNVPEGGLTVSLQTQKFEHFESYTGENLKDLVLERQTSAMGMLRLESLNKENLMLALYGTSAPLASGTISAEPHTAHLGYSFFLNRINITSFTSLTSTGGSPTTYVAGTDYVVRSLKTGEIFIPSDSDIPDAGAVRANYVAGASEQIDAYNATNKDVWLRFNGLNYANGNAPVVFEAYKCRFSPVKTIDLITTQNLTSLEMDLDVLYQPLLDGVSGYGKGFFRMIQTTA
jgi:hypothetical protein